MYDDVALDKDLAVLESQGAKVFTIGYTVLGRPIKCVVKGNLSGPCVFVQASMHAREYITTPLVIEMMKNYNGNVGVWCGQTKCYLSSTKRLYREIPCV